MSTALCAVVLKFLTGAKLITEVMIAPERACLTDRPSPGAVDRLRHFYSDACLHFTILLSDRAHLLYPKQLSHYPRLRHKPRSVFHDYTPLSGIAPPRDGTQTCQYILMAGAPWYRKGADLAVAAFRRLAPYYPDLKLKIVGHFPEGTLQALVAGSPQIEVLMAIPHDEMMQMVSHASIMLLPSRNEGLPRILIEGMAAGLPVVGSDVAGIPLLIREGENGFVVPDGDIPMLEKRLRELLSDASLRRRMGECSIQLARTTFTERIYAEQFTQMVNDTV